MSGLTKIAILLAAPDPYVRWFEKGLYFVLAVVALLALFLVRQPQHAELWGTFWFGVVTGGVWKTAAGSSLSLIRDARLMGMPSIARAVSSAMLFLFAVTVLFPAVVLGLRGGDYIVVSGLLACVAFSTALLQELPGVQLPTIFGCIYLSNSGRLEHLVNPSHPRLAAFIWLAAAMFGALAALRWTWQLQRQPERWHAEPHNNANSPIANVPRKLHFIKSIDSSGPEYPVLAMRTWLGPPFTARRWQLRKEYLQNGTFGLLLIGVFIASGDMGILSFGLIVLALMPPRMFQERLRILFQRHSDELAELALLPGWNNAERARRILLRVALQPQLIRLFMLWLMVALLAFATDADAGMYLIIVCMAIGSALTRSAFCLRTLAGLPQFGELVRTSSSAVLPIIAFAGAVVLTGVISLSIPKTIADNGSRSGALLVVVAAWLAVYLLMGLLTLAAWGRFVARPHPFLAN